MMFPYVSVYLYMYTCSCMYYSYVWSWVYNRGLLKLVDKFTYLGSSVSSTEADVNTRLAKAWTAINQLSVILKSDLTDKIKRSFFPVLVVLILIYGCTSWTLTKRTEKKLDSNYTSPGGNTPQNSCCTATYHLSHKISKLDEVEMLDIAEEVRTNS